MLPTNNLTYKLILAGYGDRDVNPLGEKDFKVQFILSNQDENPRYSYELKCVGSLTFAGEDYVWIYGAETSGYRCSDMFIEIKSSGCGEGFEEIITGTKVRLSEGQWDLDKCTVTIPVTTPDPYECINLKKDDELNIFEAPGDAAAVEFYDYTPYFEYQISSAGTDGADFEDQQFEWYPNRRCEYPGFGCENEEAEPYYPESGAGSLTLFLTEDLKRLVRNATTFEEILSTGSLPYHSDYPGFSGAFDAAAEGWRLCWFKWQASNTPDPIDNNLNWVGRWKWVRERFTVGTGDPPPPGDWVLVSSDISGDHYCRPPIMVPRVRKYEPSKEEIDFPGSFRLQFTYSNYIIGATTNVVENEDGGVSLGDDNVFGFKELPNGKFLNNIIAQAIGHCYPELEVVSDFFQINPETESTDNYVTGEDSFVDEIVVYQKSDVKRPWATSHATVGIYTPQELLNWLWRKFQVKYTIYGTTFRLEHISNPIFRKPYSIDTTALPYSVYTAFQRRYTYNIEGLKAKETFSFMEVRKQVAFSPDDDFAGVPITYYGNCVNRKENQNVQKHELQRITNDVLFILINSGGAETQVTDNETSNSYKVTSDIKRGVISDDGFTFVASRLDGGNRFGVIAPAILSDFPIFNNVMGWAHLHENFYRTDRNALDGTLNGADVTFDSTKYVKKQTRLSFKECCIVGFDPFEKIKSELGEGVVLMAEWSPYDQMMSVDLLFMLQ